MQGMGVHGEANVWDWNHETGQKRRSSDWEQ